MTVTDLAVILDNHKKWLRNEAGGVRADLREADLSCADLREADLSCADLRGADLRMANLREADLRWADLSGAKLGGADLRMADLSCADLREADLSCADLRGAKLGEADLRWADLSGAKLGGADLLKADLSGANLDFSCLPLWCGGSRFKCSPSLIQQIFAHVSTLVCEDADDELKAALDAIKGEAMKSHRAGDLGLKE